ncbi:MAG TPA: hypothetical protein VHE99_11970 [Gammaproteobacteria bacterium]|nr:hypothetical protein [Gammaproteobacteria bacterium]
MNDIIIPKDDKNYNITVIIYALQAASFIVGITFLIAVIMNYVKRKDVENTWLASHFTWQIRTFWYALLWLIIGGVTTFIIIGFPILIVTTIWVIYRIAKGWIYVYDKKPMYSQSQP